MKVYAIVLKETGEFVSPEVIRRKWPNYGYGGFKISKKLYVEVGKAKNGFSYLPDELKPLCKITTFIEDPTESIDGAALVVEQNERAALKVFLSVLDKTLRSPPAPEAHSGNIHVPQPNVDLRLLAEPSSVVGRLRPSPHFVENPSGERKFYYQSESVDDLEQYLVKNAVYITQYSPYFRAYVYYDRGLFASEVWVEGKVVAAFLESSLQDALDVATQHYTPQLPVSNHAPSPTNCPT